MRLPLPFAAAILRCPSLAWALVLPFMGAGRAHADAVLRSDSTDSSSNFGWDVDVSGRWAIVGASNEKVNDLIQSGAAYLFQRSGFGWTQVRRFTGNPPAANVLFGNAVAIDDDVALVGAPGLTAGGVSSRGGVMVYRRSGTANWDSGTLLIAPGGAANDIFGDAVALDAAHMAIGAPRADVSGLVDAGRVYLYTRAGVYLQTLAAPDPAAGDQFGDRVSISGDYLFVASPEDDASPTLTNAGSAYVFRRSGAAWVFSQKLVLPDAARDDFFGAEVAVKGNQAVLGCRGDDTPTLGSGAVYPYKLTGTTWAADGPRLLSSQPRQFDVFGGSVALDRDKIVVGAFGDGTTDTPNAGAVYVFEKIAGNWVPASKRTAQPAEDYAALGNSVAVRDGTILAGSYASDPAGAAYSFRCEVNPVVFIPGIAGSRLVNAANGEQLWPTIDPGKILQLKLGNGINAVAVDIARSFVPLLIWSIDLYQPLIVRFKNAGYVEYPLNDDPGRLASIPSNLNPKPTLFPFPYDWRRSNADHVQALRTYINRIRELHPGRDVDIVAHSMGGLLARRMILTTGQEGIGRVATLGSPFWGTPVATERILAGNFFDISIVDFFANNEIQEVLGTFPAFFELLPSQSYWNNLGSDPTILAEEGWNLNNKGSSSDEYDQDMFWDFMNGKAGPPVPSATNAAFHNYAGQDNWRNDSLPVPYFHAIGNLGGASTVKKVIAKGQARYDGECACRRFGSEKGPGDGTVSLLSASRAFTDFTANSHARVFDSSSGDVEHLALAQNEKVFAAVAEFLEAGTVDTEPCAAVPAKARTTVRLTGCGYTRVRDGAGNENTRLSSIAAVAVPGVDIQYGGSEPWMNIEADSDRDFKIDGAALAEPMEAEVVTLDAARNPTSLRRFRFTPSSTPWLLQATAAQPATLILDANANGAPDAGESLAPSHASSPGQPVDVTTPTIALQMAVQGGLATLIFQAADPGSAAAPVIKFRISNQPLATYAAPLVLPLAVPQQIRAFAEDAAGNVSGLIETAIRPPVDIERSGPASITLTWSSADGYVLEESGATAGNWQRSTAPVVESGTQRRVILPVSPAPPQARFFRLKFEGVAR